MSDLIYRLRSAKWIPQDDMVETCGEAVKEIERLEGDLNIMRLQRNAKHCSRCPECAKEFVYSYGTNTAATEQGESDANSN